MSSLPFHDYKEIHNQATAEKSLPSAESATAGDPAASTSSGFRTSTIPVRKRKHKTLKPYTAKQSKFDTTFSVTEDDGLDEDDGFDPVSLVRQFTADEEYARQLQAELDRDFAAVQSNAFSHPIHHVTTSTNHGTNSTAQFPQHSAVPSDNTAHTAAVSVSISSLHYPQQSTSSHPQPPVLPRRRPISYDIGVTGQPGSQVTGSLSVVGTSVPPAQPPALPPRRRASRSTTASTSRSGTNAGTSRSNTRHSRTRISSTRSNHHRASHSTGRRQPSNLTQPLNHRMFLPNVEDSTDTDDSEDYPFNPRDIIDISSSSASSSSEESTPSVTSVPPALISVNIPIDFSAIIQYYEQASPLHQRNRNNARPVNHFNPRTLNDTYEELHELGQQIGEARPNRLTATQINQLPKRPFDGSTNSAGGKTECDICMTEYNRRVMIRTLPCFHEFHSTCIDNWLKINATCPICRVVVKV